LSEGGSSRRDLFRLLGKPFLEAARRGVPSADEAPSPPTPGEEVPVERGRLVVDLSVHPLVPGTGRRFLGAGAPETILLARVSADHLAAVSGDCPHCGGPLAFSGERDAVLCPRGRASFRLDGCVIEGAGHLRLRTYLCRRAGQRVEIDLRAP
jgi:nitrite reductase/ring-hydroxylating ferredoxin subunit